MCGDAREQLLGRLDDRAALAHQVAGAEHRHGIVGQRRQHVRTVRSAAYARNRPRRRLAWLLALILLLLIALAARVDASPADDARRSTGDGFAEAIRYANILTGDAPDEPSTSDLDEEDNDERDGDGDGCDDDDRDDDDGDDDDCSADEDNPGGRAADGRDLEGAIAGDRDADSRTAGERDGLDGDDDSGPKALTLAGDNDDEPDRSARLEDMSSDLAGGELADHIAGELALQEERTATADAAGGDDVSFATASAGAAETYESWMRHQRPSPWGRLDVGVAWRQRWSEPMSGGSRRYDEVWLVATWSR